MASIVPREWELSEALRVPATNDNLPIENCLLLDCLSLYGRHSAAKDISLLLDWLPAQPPPSPPTIHVSSHPHRNAA